MNERMDLTVDEDQPAAASATVQLYCLPTGKTIAPGSALDGDSFGLWHGAGPKMVVRFLECDEPVELPHAALVASFEYFKRMLSDRTVTFLEASGKSVKFGDTMSAFDFGVLITWLQTGLLKLPKDEVKAITTCISSIIAADYLGMINIQKYVLDIKTCFVQRLVDNRLALTGNHLLLMQQHCNLFDKTGIAIMATKAGVRPFLTAQQVATSSSATAEQKETASHFQSLMDNNPIYAASVLGQVRRTLLAGHRQDKVALASEVVLGEGTLVATTYERFDLVRYWDPLYRVIPSNKSKAAFKL